MPSSDIEGFGTMFMAAVCGKPSVAGKEGGAGAVVEDGVTALRIVVSVFQKLVPLLDYCCVILITQAYLKSKAISVLLKELLGCG